MCVGLHSHTTNKIIWGTQMWAVCLNKVRMAQFFWRLAPDSMSTALVATKILDGMKAAPVCIPSAIVYLTRGY